MNNENKPLVLVVEDDKINSMVVNKFLAKDYDYDNAYNGMQAIDLCKNKKYDLILMDISLGDPDIDGVTTMKEIKKLDINKNTKFIAVTSFAMQGDKQALIKEGFDDYMSKPIYKDQLLNLMKKYL